MNSVKIATLKNGLSQYLETVRRGGEIVVIDRDTPIARIVPYGAHGSALLAELVKNGTVRRGSSAGVRRWLDSKPPAKLPRGASAVKELIKERRESNR